MVRERKKHFIPLFDHFFDFLCYFSSSPSSLCNESNILSLKSLFGVT
jgi:hypothetical protein